MADPAYSEENQAAIALSPDRPSGSVIISIRKAGIITLDVRDKTTGKRVSGWYKLSLPQRWETQGETRYPLLIHPATDGQTRHSKFQLLDTKHGFIPMRQIPRGACHCGSNPASKNP